eukprot:5241081-Prymnesium_polylepis.1
MANAQCIVRATAAAFAIVGMARPIDVTTCPMHLCSEISRNGTRERSAYVDAGTPGTTRAMLDSIAASAIPTSKAPHSLRK